MNALPWFLPKHRWIISNCILSSSPDYNAARTYKRHTAVITRNMKFAPSTQHLSGRQLLGGIFRQTKAESKTLLLAGIWMQIVSEQMRICGALAQ